jgi:hypothetical protein
LALGWGGEMKVGDLFRRTKDSEGLPLDYELKEHHRRGYSSIIRHIRRRVIIDENGRKHGKLSIEVLSNPNEEWVRRSLAANQQEYYTLISMAKDFLPDEVLKGYLR